MREWLEEAEVWEPELPVLTRSMLPPLWPESLLLVLDSLFLLSLSLASCNDGDEIVSGYIIRHHQTPDTQVFSHILIVH